MAKGLFNLGVLYVNARGLKKDISKARYFYAKACNMDNSRACNNLGASFYDEKDYEKALVLYEKSCAMNEAVACKNLAFLYENAMGTEKNKEKAEAFYLKACILGNEEACVFYKNLSVFNFFVVDIYEFIKNIKERE